MSASKIGKNKPTPPVVRPLLRVCSYCPRLFTDVEALDAHHVADHGFPSKKKLKEYALLEKVPNFKLDLPDFGLMLAVDCAFCNENVPVSHFEEHQLTRHIKKVDQKDKRGAVKDVEQQNSRVEPEPKPTSPPKNPRRIRKVSIRIRHDLPASPKMPKLSPAIPFRFPGVEENDAASSATASSSSGYASPLPPKKRTRKTKPSRGQAKRTLDFYLKDNNDGDQL